MALQNRSEQECSVEWLLEEAKSAMRLFIEDMTQQKKEDNILVEKVRNLEARVKEPDRGRKYQIQCGRTGGISGHGSGGDGGCASADRR